MRPFGRHTPTRALAGAVAGLALFAVGGCGSDSGGDTAQTVVTGEGTDTLSSPDPTVPSDGTAPEPAAPDGGTLRVVSLSPTHTEMMFAIGAGDMLVAVEEFSNYPPEALELPNELSGFEPNVEAIASYEPDLVLIGGDFTGLGAQLDELDIGWWDGPAATTLDDTYAQLEQLGALTGNVAEATELVAQMQADIELIIADTPVPDPPLTIYHEVDSTYFSADSTTFIGQVYALLGLQNIADRAEGDSGGYPQLSAEAIVSADPDLIFLADTKYSGESAETVATRPGWDAMTAVRNGNVVAMDDDIASRWGPRVVEYLAAVSAAVRPPTVPA